jgi:hypothetical protein
MRRDDEPGYGSPEWNSRAFAQADRWRLIKLEQFVHGGPYFMEHRQDEPADVWLIEHGWGHKPYVQVLSPAGEVVYAEVQHLDDDRLEIRFAVPYAGSAVLSLGATSAPVIRTDQPPKEAHGLTELQIRRAARRRGRSLSNWREVYDAAIREVGKQHAKLTWGNVATEMGAATGVSIHESTLRRWCNEECVSHPGERERELART